MTQFKRTLLATGVIAALMAGAETGTNTGGGSTAGVDAGRAANLAKLGEFDFIFIGDDSGSMQGTDCPGGKSRWDYMQESMLGLMTEIGKVDSDGIGIVFVSGRVAPQDGVTTDKLPGIFASTRPAGGTPMHTALTNALKLGGTSNKKKMIIAFTDGEPDDANALENVIRTQSNGQASDDACTILFIQVGQDAKATAALQKLDDDIPGAKYDIVDAKTIAQVDAYPSIVDLLIDAING